jgi:hypothetical protein
MLILGFILVIPRGIIIHFIKFVIDLKILHFSCPPLSLIKIMVIIIKELIELLAGIL